MSDFSIESCGSYVNIISDFDLQTVLSTAAYTCFFPDLTFGPYQPGFPSVFYHNSKKNRLTFKPNSVDVCFPWSQMQNGETIFYLAYPLMERWRQLNRSLTAHAASVYHHAQRKGVLLLGKEGSGKSMAIIELCRHHGFRLSSNDLAVLQWQDQAVSVIGGTKILYLRLESVKRNLPDLVDKAFWPDLDSWLSKAKFGPEALKILTIKNHPVSRAYLVHIDETKQELKVSDPPEMKTTLYLNETFSRYIRNTPTTMLGEGYRMIGYVPSLDDEKFYCFRREMIEYLMDQLKLKHLSGPLKKVTEFIAAN